MRRLTLLPAILVLALLAVPLGVLAASNETYRDKFDDGNYAGSDGSIEWEPVWTEVGDDGSHTSGKVRVTQDSLCASGDCLRITGSGLPLLGGGITAGAGRPADTRNFTSSVLSYRVGSESLLLGVLEKLEIQVRNVSSNWVTVDTYSVTSVLGGPHQKSVDISAFASGNFAVRFRATGLLGGSTVFIDDVEIKGEIEEPPTTTTTTTSTTSTTTPSITIPSITIPSITTTTVKATTTTTSRQLTTTTTTPSSPTTSTERTTTTTSAQTTTSHDPQSTTSTTVAGTTTTTSNDDDGSVVALGPGEPPQRGGNDEIDLHQATRGIQAGLTGGLFADVALVPVFDPVDVDFNFGLVAEEIETSWLWMTLFGLVLTWALVSDLDRRRLKGLRSRAPSREVF